MEAVYRSERLLNHRWAGAEDDLVSDCQALVPVKVSRIRDASGSVDKEA
jgi:hypothetical protein